MLFYRKWVKDFGHFWTNSSKRWRSFHSETFRMLQNQNFFSENSRNWCGGQQWHHCYNRKWPQMWCTYVIFSIIRVPAVQPVKLQRRMPAANGRSKPITSTSNGSLCYYFPPFLNGIQNPAGQESESFSHVWLQDRRSEVTRASPNNSQSAGRARSTEPQRDFTVEQKCSDPHQNDSFLSVQTSSAWAPLVGAGGVLRVADVSPAALNLDTVVFSIIRVQAPSNHRLCGSARSIRSLLSFFPRFLPSRWWSTSSGSCWPPPHISEVLWSPPAFHWFWTFQVFSL